MTKDMLHTAEATAWMRPVAGKPGTSDAASAAGASVYSVDGNAALQLPDGAWQLSALLQTSLELEKVVALFARELSKRVPYDGFSYRHAEKGVHLELGEVARHRASYRLLLEGRALGEIAISRARRFSDAEVTSIENLIGGLVYALRNALLYREAVESALRDALTGLANRAALEAALKREIGLSQRHGLPLSAVMIDIDKFKRINDSYGHAVGDLVLRTLAATVTECVRGTDVPARLGGEEFVVILPGTDASGAELLANRIRAAVEALRCEVQGLGTRAALQFTVSLGVATSAGETGEQLLKRADEAMYAAKRAGGNRVAIGD